jgi:hypothetical protein
MIMGQPVKKEVAVLLRVLKDTDGDQFGGIAAIAETVTDGLTKRGIANQLYAANDDHPGTPRIEIWVSKWTAGDSDLQTTGRVVGGIVGAAIGGAGAGEYKVSVKVYRQGDAEAVCVRRDSGSVDASDADGAASLGESIGKWILSVALSETAECGAD